MEYQDFVLQIEADAEGSYAVQVVNSPAGEGRGHCALSFSPREVAAVASSVARAVVADRQRDLGSANRAPVVERGLESLGGALFREVFSGQVRSRFDESVGRLGERDDLGLRIKLRMDLDDPAVARLHSLPWEYLFRSEDRSFLALGRRTSVVRYLNLPLPANRPPLPLPLRILVAMPEPAGLVPLDFRRERERIQKAWGRGGAEIVFLERATLERLRGELLSRSFHVLHLMGHGEFDPVTGEGVLMLEDDEGRPVAVSGEVLAAHVRDCTSLRLVFLNVCHTARAAAAGPFSGVATALLLAGLPAVVAMQFPISDRAAIAFSEEFYQRLAAGDPVDAAVAEGRLALHRRWPGTSEWGTPVLFLRSPDGHIFHRAAQSAQVLPPPAPRKSTVRLAGLGLAAMLTLFVSLGLWQRMNGSLPPTDSARDHQQAPKETSPAPAPAPVKTADTPTDPVRRTHQPQHGENSLRKAQVPPPVPKVEDPAPTQHLVADGEAVFLREINASVTAQFLSLAGEDMIRLSLTPAGSASLNRPPFFPPQTLTFEGNGRRYLLNVSGVDWTSRTLRVTPALAPL